LSQQSTKLSRPRIYDDNRYFKQQTAPKNLPSWACKQQPQSQQSSQQSSKQSAKQLAKQSIKQSSQQQDNCSTLEYHDVEEKYCETSTLRSAMQTYDDDIPTYVTDDEYSESDE
jgi:hypothetical protein